MNKWEYKTNLYPSLKELADDLDFLGKDGWELICLERVDAQLAREQMQWFAIFKQHMDQV